MGEDDTGQTSESVNSQVFTIFDRPAAAGPEGAGRLSIARLRHDGSTGIIGGVVCGYFST